MASKPDTTRVSRQVLEEDSRDADLRDLGFTSVPFLGEEQIRSLSEAYWAHAPAADHGLTIDYMRPERDLVRTLSEILEPVLSPAVDEFLVNHKIVLATFVVKHPGENSAMFLHDDRSYVDERKYRATTLWIPLVDVGPGIPNGGLQVVPRSHLLPTGWAGSNTPDLIRPWESTLRSALEPVEAAAGTAVVYDTRLLHASEPNLSNAPRIAIACAVAPAEADLYHVRAVGRRTRHLHAIDREFFLDHHPREIEQRLPDDCPVVERFEDEAELDDATIEGLLGLEAMPLSVPVPGDLVDSVNQTISPIIHEIDRPCDSRRPADLRIDTSGFDHGTTPVAVLDVVESHGEVGILSLKRRFRRRKAPPHTTWDCEEQSARFVRDQDLLVLEAGARAVVVVPRTPRWRAEVRTLECPVVGGGIGDKEGAASAHLDRALFVPQGRELTIWNDGPGQLVLVASRTPDPDDRMGAIMSRLTRASWRSSVLAFEPAGRKRRCHRIERTSPRLTNSAEDRDRSESNS